MKTELWPIEHAAGPAPWYGGLLTDYTYDASLSLEWGILGDGKNESGRIALKRGGQPVMVFNLYNYIVPFAGSKLLVWNQMHGEGPITGPINLAIFDINLMTPLDDLPSVLTEMSDKALFFYCNAGLAKTVQIPTTDISAPLQVDIPEEISFLDELLILCNSSAIGPGTREKSNRCLAIVSIAKKECRFYPQDWFNNGGYDYGYEWITRVARDTNTGRIMGDGIRIQGFVLDNSLRNIEKEAT